MQEEFPIKEGFFEFALAQFQHATAAFSQCGTQHVAVVIHGDPLNDRMGGECLGGPGAVAGPQRTLSGADHKAKLGVSLVANKGIDNLVADVTFAENDKAARLATHQPIQCFSIAEVTECQAEFPRNVDNTSRSTKGFAHQD